MAEVSAVLQGLGLWLALSGLAGYAASIVGTGLHRRAIGDGHTGEIA